MIMKFGILKSFKEIDFLAESYAKACEECGVEWIMLDLFSDDWIEQIEKSGVDGILVREKANFAEYKAMYDERLWTITQYLHIPIYPSWHELYLYENKRMYSYFFETHDVPTPNTHVFYDKKSAIDYCKSANYPLVFKTNGGSAGSGVRIAKKKREAVRWVENVFGRIDPHLTLGKCMWTKVGGFLPVPKIGMSQRHYAIIQEYLDVGTEWRIIKIGGTYAGYQRPLEHGHGSCDKMVYGFPPEELLYLIKRISEENNFGSLSLDVLATKDGKYYVTEMQSLYGSFSPDQCMVDGISGRIIYKDSHFVFEKGNDFFKYNSNVLRVKDFISRIKNESNCHQL